jgi:hypothetical protein
MLSAAAHPRALTDGDRLAVARKRFLSGESVAPDEVRETILASWQRSPAVECRGRPHRAALHPGPQP